MMRHLRLFVLRELLHFKGWILLLVVLLALTVVLHFSLLTILVGESLALFLAVLKNILVPLCFVFICGLIGYADSPDLPNHELKTRPARLKMLYLGKFMVVFGGAALLALVQSLMNLSAGFPIAFGSLWWTLVMLGSICLFAGGVFRAEARFLFHLSLAFAWVWAVLCLIGNFTPLLIRDPDFEVWISGGAFSLGLLFLLKLMYRVILVPFSLIALVTIYVLAVFPSNFRKADPRLLDDDLRDRLEPEIYLKESGFRNDELWLGLRGQGSADSLLRRLDFVKFSLVGIDSQGNEIHVVEPFAGRKPRPVRGDDLELLRALDLLTNPSGGPDDFQAPEYNLIGLGKAVGLREEDRNHLVLNLIPEEHRDKDLDLVFEGEAFYTEVTPLGTLPLQVGAKLRGERMSVELVKFDRIQGAATLRVHCRSDRLLQLLARRITGRNSTRVDLTDDWLVREPELPGMSKVIFLRVWMQFPPGGTKTISSGLQVFSVTGHGSFPFRSKPIPHNLNPGSESASPSPDPE